MKEKKARERKKERYSSNGKNICLKCKKRSDMDLDVFSGFKCIYHPGGNEYAKQNNKIRVKCRWPVLTYNQDRKYHPCCR